MPVSVIAFTKYRCNMIKTAISGAITTNDPASITCRVKAEDPLLNQAAPVGAARRRIASVLGETRNVKQKREFRACVNA
jgi:hypothetical protein